MYARIQIWRYRPQLQPFTRTSKQISHHMHEASPRFLLLNATFLEESFSGCVALRGAPFVSRSQTQGGATRNFQLLVAVVQVG